MVISFTFAQNRGAQPNEPASILQISHFLSLYEFGLFAADFWRS
jgi:hypothetical protein